MNVGDLVKFYNKNSVYHIDGFGIVVEPYDGPKGLWMIHWFRTGETNPCLERWLKVLKT